MPPQVIFFDAAGTLIHLREPVGEVYSRTAARFGVEVAPAAVTPAFRAAWKTLPPPEHEVPPDDDDRSWWRALVGRTFEITQDQAPLEPEVLEPLFDALYWHFAEPEAWMVFDDVRPALERFKPHCRLFVLSNFDRRLRTLLSGHGLTDYFEGMIISSEIGVSKPHPRIFQAALALAKAAPGDCLHVGDDEKADIAGAAGQGIPSHLVRRPGGGLMDLAEKLFPG